MHGQSPDKARLGIDGYRHQLAQHKAVDAIYHSEPREIAKAIVGGRFRQDPPRS